MLGTRTRKITRELTARKGRSLMVILSILIGVFGVTTMISMTDLINRYLSKDIQADAISHTHVYLMNPGEQIVDNQPYLDTIRQMEGVVDVEGQAVFPIFWRHSSEQYSDGFVVSFSEPFGEASLEPVSRIIAGRYPQAGEIAVEQRFADAHDIQIGDQLTFQTDPDQTWEVVGTVIHSYFTMSPAAQDQIPPDKAIYMNYTDASTRLGIKGLSAIHVRYANKEAAQAGLNPLLETVAQSTPYIPLFTFLDDPEANFITTIIEQVNLAFIILGVMAVVVSGFLITNIMNTIIVEQKQQIGVLKSLGATFWDTFGIYAGIAFCYGIIGSGLGILLAIPVASLGAQAMAPVAFTYIPGFEISWLGVLTGLFLGLLVPVLAAIIPVLNGTRISILEAMSDFGISSEWGLSPISRLIGRLPFPRMVVQAISSIYQKKGRLALTGLTLMLATAAFMSVQATSNTLDHFVGNLFNAVDYDVVVSLQGMEDEQSVRDLLLKNIPDIAAVYSGYSTSVSIEGYASTNAFTKGSDQITATGIEPEQPAFDLGTDWRGEGLVISQSLADNLGKQVGDHLTLTIGDQTADYPITGIAAYAFDALFIDWRELARATNYLNAANEPVPTLLYLKFGGERSIQQMETHITTLSDLLASQGIEATYTNQPQNEQNQIQQVGLFGTVFTLTAGILAAVGAVGLMAALSMAVLERQKEIGVMRSVGASSSTIMGQFLLEGMLIGGLSWLVAVPLSVVLGAGLLAMLPFDYLDFSYQMTTPIIGLIGMLLVAMIASLLPSWLASRKTISEILRYH
jgi:putative ABC transport system permease protein